MNAEVSDRAALHAALGDPLRLSVAEALLLGDRSPDGLARQFEASPNLLAHHVNVLVRAGVVERIQSEGDRRRRYLRLTDAGQRLVAPWGAMVGADRLTFVCTHNSARSQFAEALWRRRSPRLPVCSAGTSPADRVHPLARAVAARHGVDLGPQSPSALTHESVVGALVVTVCDSADQELLPVGVDHVHWSVPDPVRMGTLDAFEQAWSVVERRVATLANFVAEGAVA